MQKLALSRHFAEQQLRLLEVKVTTDIELYLCNLQACEWLQRGCPCWADTCQKCRRRLHLPLLPPSRPPWRSTCATTPRCFLADALHF